MINNNTQASDSAVSEETISKINKIVTNNKIVLFMKGSADAPMCGFSAKVAQILGILGVEFISVNVLEDAEIRQGIKQYSDWPTIPQLYILGEFIGGCDIIYDMYSSGELEELFRAKDIK